MEFTAFASDYVEQIASFVECIVVEFEPVCAGALEEPFIDWPDFLPATLDSTQRTVHCHVWRICPVLLHQVEIACVEGMIKLRESLQRLRSVTVIVAPSDRRLNDSVRSHDWPLCDYDEFGRKKGSLHYPIRIEASKAGIPEILVFLHEGEAKSYSHFQ